MPSRRQNKYCLSHFQWVAFRDAGSHPQICDSDWHGTAVGFVKPVPHGVWRPSAAEEGTEKWLLV